MKTKITTRIALIAATLAVVIFASFMLSACNKPATSGDVEYGVYIRRTLYQKDAHTMTVYASLSQDERWLVEGATAKWHYEKVKVNAFYNAYEYTVTFDPATIFSAIENSLTQEQRIIDDVEYDILKVVFEYATIYKSLEGGKDIGKSDVYYLHDFDVDETATDFTATMSLRTQNSAAWYGLLIAAAVVVLGVIIAVLFARRKKYACKERTEDQ